MPERGHPTQARYLAYCAATGGLSPEDTWARDRNGARYLCWINRQWSTWRALTGRTRPATLADHAAFDAWLSGQVEVSA